MCFSFKWVFKEACVWQTQGTLAAPWGAWNSLFCEWVWVQVCAKEYEKTSLLLKWIYFMLKRCVSQWSMEWPMSISNRQTGWQRTLKKYLDSPCISASLILNIDQGQRFMSLNWLFRFDPMSQVSSLLPGGYWLSMFHSYQQRCRMPTWRGWSASQPWRWTQLVEVRREFYLQNRNSSGIPALND